MVMGANLESEPLKHFDTKDFALIERARELKDSIDEPLSNSILGMGN